MPNSKSKAGAKADSEQKDEEMFVSQHSRKPNVVCSQSPKFMFSPNGYLEAQKWLKDIGKWDMVSTKGFSTDGYSIVAEANAIWSGMYDVKLEISCTENRVWVQIGNIGVGYDKISFVSMVMQSESYKFAETLRE